MSRLFSILGPTVALYGAMYLFVEIVRVVGAWRGIISKPTEVAMFMDWDAPRTQSPEKRYVSNLRSWIRSK